MGLTSSVQDNYILKYENTIENSAELFQPAKYPRKGSKVHPSQPQLARTQSTLAIPGKDRQARLSLSAAPNRQSSMPNMLAPLKLDKAVRTSDKYKWLLKDGHFGIYTLNDFEFGRVIGKLLFSIV
jgi:hypothetical protein